jgi:hypothetical protein
MRKSTDQRYSTVLRSPRAVMKVANRVAPIRLVLACESEATSQRASPAANIPKAVFAFMDAQPGTTLLRTAMFKNQPTRTARPRPTTVRPASRENARRRAILEASVALSPTFASFRGRCLDERNWVPLPQARFGVTVVNAYLWMQSEHSYVLRIQVFGFSVRESGATG